MAMLPVMTDCEVAEFFHISTKTLQRRVNRPLKAKGEIDLNDACPGKIGGKRFWLRAEVERLARSVASRHVETAERR